MVAREKLTDILKTVLQTIKHLDFCLKAFAVLHLNDGSYALIELKLGQTEIDDGSKHLCEIENLIKEYNKTEKRIMNVPEKSLRQDVFAYVKKKYKSNPEYLWKRYPDYAVFRHTDNQKWYGIIMNVGRDKLGLTGTDVVDILNVKLDDLMYRDILLQQDGILPGYHISRGNWISILLDGTVDIKQICDLIDSGYEVTASAKKKQKIRQPKEWIIPANPKFYDIEHAFDDTDEIDWKQGSGIKAGDTVFMYVAAPVSSILYKCKILETDIPYKYQDDNLTIKALMRIKLLKRYKPDRFTFDVLKDEYGIYAIRGPRGITNSLSAALKK